MSCQTNPTSTLLSSFTPGRLQAAEARLSFAKETLRQVIQRESYPNLQPLLYLECDSPNSVDSVAAELEMTMNRICEAINLNNSDERRTSKVKELIRRWFRVSYPFIQTILDASKAGSSIAVVAPYGLICAALMTLTKIAYDESRRGKEIDETIHVLSNAVHRIQLTADISTDFPVSKLEEIQCAALNLCSAIMEYLAIALQILKRSVLKNVMKNAFQGNSVFEEAVAKINTATADYSTAVQDLTLIVGLHVFNQTQTVVNSVDEISVQLEKFILDRDRRAITTEPDLRENYTTQPFSSLFLVPYPRNQLFIGREPYFELIRTMLSTTAPKRYNHCVALFGLGGIGKTQIALEYAHRCRDEYNFVFWLHAAERTLLLSDYARIAQQTRCVKSSQDILPENMAVEVLNWMKGESNWLVVLDNVDDVTVVRGLLPETTSGGHVLITTRCNDVKLIPSEGLEVTVMEKGESLELLLAECDGDGQEELLDDARDIVDELGYLPLAISQAAAFIRTSDLSSFLEVFRSSKDEFLAENPEGNHPYPRSISMTWLMCLQRLSSDSIELLELISYLNPDEILAEFLERTIPAMGENLRRIIGKKFTYIKALSGLQLFSLIKVRDGGRKLSIHRLLQSVIRDSIPMPRRRKLQSEVLAMASLIFDSYSLEKLAMESRIQYRKFLPQFSSAFDYFEQDIYESFAISPLSESIAAFWYEEGQQNESEALNCKLLEIRKRKLGPEHPGTLRVMRGLGAVYAGFSDRYDLAIGIYEETLASQTRVLGPSDPDTLWTQHSLGVAYDAAGMSDKAATMLRETYNTRSLVLGKHHLHTLRTKFWLAMVYEHLGLGMEAKVLLEESMTDTTRTLGESHADTLRVMHCLASLYARQGRLSEAAQMFKKAFFLRRTTFGEHHWLTIQARDVCKTFENAVKEKEDIARYNTENIKRWCQRGNQSTGKSDECGRNVSRDLPGPNEDESEESDDSEEFANLARLF